MLLKGKYNYIICVFCTCLFLVFTSNVYASNDKNSIVNAYKVWEIKFNQPVDFNKLTKDSIQVRDKNNNLVDVSLGTGDSDDTVEVIPPEKGYNLGEEYTLIITKQVYSEKNKQVKDEKSFNFKIKETSEKPIVFKDDKLEEIVRKKIKKYDLQPIYKSDVEKITKLECYKGIKDISGIENLVNLKSLSLTYCEIEDISPLKGLNNLEELMLYDDNITDVSPLRGLTNLKFLELYGNQITDIGSLEGLINLKSLDLANNRITDITPLKGLTKLESLDLYYNSIKEDYKDTLKKDLPNCDIN